MNSPKVSVVIPAYKQAEYLGSTIQSVLNQTYTNFEVIVVNDASPDNTTEVVQQFQDPRLKYIIHERNQMLPAARNTGMRAAKGEIIALLDADDLFHPNKLAAHVAYLAQHPEIGVTYNARFDVDAKGNPLSLWRPRTSTSLPDFVLGFPFAPSDMVLRREWAFKVDLFDESYVVFSEDLDINCRLALAGCQFAGINQPLNYRRYHANRVIRNIKGRLDSAIRALDTTFADPRCPAAVKNLRHEAYRNHYLDWAYCALAQHETVLGQQYLCEAIHHDPALLAQDAAALINFLIVTAVHDGGDHETGLQRIFAQLPPDLAWVARHSQWAIGQGYLWRGVKSILWHHEDEGASYLARAAQLGTRLDETFLRSLTDQFISYEAEFGPEATRQVLRSISRHLNLLGSHTQISWLQGCYWFNHAFRAYSAGLYTQVPVDVLRAVLNDSSYVVNRGILRILFHAVVPVRRPKLDEYGQFA
jgi:glycosyltransferase involved in cell wall biosynthesis